MGLNHFKGQHFKAQHFASRMIAGLAGAVAAVVEYLMRARRTGRR